jgi:hypothetical protein
MRVLDVLLARVGRGRTRFIALAPAMAVVATLAGVLAATAGALAFDDARPCPAAYTEESDESITPPPFVCPGGLVGTPYAVQLVGRGSCEPYFSFAVVAGAPPPGLSLSSSGLISGVPAQAGGWRFRVRVKDLSAAENGPAWCTSSDRAEGEFTIAVNPGVIVTTESAGPGTIGARYKLALSARMISGPDQLSPPEGCAADQSVLGSCPLMWSVVQGQLPAGLWLNSVTGLIWGTPTAEGSSSFVVRAALDDGRAGTKSFTITVRQPLAIRAPKPFTTQGGPTLWEVGVPFAGKLAASGGTGAYSWSLADGALPSGLALAADGTVVGTPRGAGPFRATIRLSDDEGRTAAYPTVFGVASRLAISTLKLRFGKVGRLYRAKLATTGGRLPKKWKVKSGPLPRGIRFDRPRGVLIGTPTRPGRYRVTFEATDALKVASTRTLVIDVLA